MGKNKNRINFCGSIANSDISRIYIERNEVLDTDRINYVRIDDQNQMKFIASVK